MKETEYKIHYDNFDELKVKGVYLIRNLESNKLKIGVTNDLNRRMHEIEKSFQFCGTIPKLKIECYIEYDYNLELEQYLHKELKEYNYQNEWFSIDNIDIILNKVYKFEHKDIKKEGTIKNKKKKSTFDTEEYKYYRYELKERDINCIVYLKRKRSRYGLDGCIGNIAESVGYMWGSFHLQDWCLEELDNSLDKLDDIFLKFDTTTLALVNNIYMRLDVYLGNILMVRKLKTLNNNRYEIVKIINELTNIEYQHNDDINIIKEKINNIEEKCIKVQEYFNDSIEQHHRQNFKPFGCD